MDDTTDFRKWDELIPDALGLIFKNLSLLEVLTVVPRVCKSWGKAVTGPYCWQEIDIEEWSKNSKPEIVDRMLQLLILRSGGSARKVSVSDLKSDQSILFIANHARSLQTLRLPRSEIHDSVVETISDKLSALSSLDLSYCLNIGAEALKSIGKNCKSLTTLRRVMHPLEVIHMHSQEDEALAISTTMLKLEHLEIAYLQVTTLSVLEILKNCKHLKVLDIRGCWDVELDEKFLKGFGKLKVAGPGVMERYEQMGWDDSPESLGYFWWDFNAGDDDVDDDDWEENGIEDDFDEGYVWPYDDFDEGYVWPPSP